MARNTHGDKPGNSGDSPVIISDSAKLAIDKSNSGAEPATVAREPNNVKTDPPPKAASNQASSAKTVEPRQSGSAQASSAKAEAAPTGKNIVIFSDGTGQEGGVDNNTNVYALFNMILDRSEKQISFYDQGLGTGSRKVMGSITGRGIGKNVEEAYQFLSDTYSAGDRIYLFGFSRGAATVRTLSAFIDLFGILPRSRPELFKKAWRIYKTTNKEKRRQRAEEFVHRNHTMWAMIRFLGVWDSVAALGLPFKKLDWLSDLVPIWKHSFHDFTLSDSVEYGRHALAVDDERRTFHPVLWNERGSRQMGASATGAELFCKTNVTDIYLIAERLNDKDNVVSKRVVGMLDESTQRLLQRFDNRGGRRASKKQEDEFSAIVVQEFNDVIESGVAICDPNDEGCREQFDRLNLSAATQDCLDNLAKSFSPREIGRLNRLILEDVYSLKPRIKQVWFAGMHSDVGGGYAENELAQIPLLWMISEAMDLGLLIYGKHTVDLKPDSAGKMHDSRAGAGRAYRKRIRQWNPQEHNGRPPLVHESVVERAREDRLYKPWILKTDHDVELLPQRLETSIQFDDERIWRKPVWGWGAAFDESWNDIERISCDESQWAITLYMKKGLPIHVHGSLPRALPALVERLERKREQKRLETQTITQDEHFKAQDDELRRLQNNLKEKVTLLKTYMLTQDNYIKKDEKGDAKVIDELRKIKSELAELEKAEAEADVQQDPQHDGHD